MIVPIIFLPSIILMTLGNTIEPTIEYYRFRKNYNSFDQEFCAELKEGLQISYQFDYQ